ncbi:MAG TPA: peptidoglycan DD-metalloendopeptidase family protein [Steroidobacteraceae bacterium]|nr:peptidoglycan DD-metalloendopeptidase family protein [Steroidobacteraceae bacterium]
MLAVLLAAILAMQGGPAPAAEDTDAEKELREVRERIEALQRSMRRDTDRRDALSGQLRDAEENVRGARAKLGDIRKRLAESDASLERLAAERQRNEAALGKQREVLAAELRSAYVGGRQEQFKLLLSQDDPATLGRMLVYYSYFGRARAAKIAEIQGIVAELEEAAQAEAAERERLAALEAESRQQLSTVDAARNERSRALKSMNAQIRNRNDSIAKLKREAAALEKLVADLRRAMSDLPPTGGQAFEKVRGRLNWPVAGKIPARCGQARGGGLKWNGVMIEAARGTPVKALYDGRIAYADWLPGMGLLVIVDHGGYMSLYAHNEQIYKAVGASVSGGDAISTVGDTGGRSVPGLYLEIRRGAKAVDPVPWFRRASP